MKTSNVILYVFITLIFFYIGISLTFSAMTGQSLRGVVINKFEKNSTTTLIENLETNKCHSKSPIDFSGATDPHLLALSQLQLICDSFVTDRLMIFTGMPNSKSRANEMADQMTITLREFERFGITPIVIVEPDSDWGLIDFSEFRNGFWDSWIQDYFARLSENGITQSQMGIWVPFPEANIPTWNKQSSASADFALAINKYNTIIRKYYQNVHLSILLNSATYDVEDYDWAYGEYVSLNPYIQKIDTQAVQSFGIQGFPWLPKKTSQSTTSLTEPSEYLNYLLSVEAAQTLSVNEIWFNTGTFASKYTNDSDNTIFVEAEDRMKILDKTLEEANKIKSRNYDIWINIFAEDKSTTPEATNWSFTENQPDIELNSKVLKDFLQKAEVQDIKVALFIKKTSQ